MAQDGSATVPTVAFRVSAGFRLADFGLGITWSALRIGERRSVCHPERGKWSKAGRPYRRRSKPIGQAEGRNAAAHLRIMAALNSFAE